MSFKQPETSATKPATVGAPKRRRTAEGVESTSAGHATGRQRQRSPGCAPERELRPDPATTEQRARDKEERKVKRRRTTTAVEGQAGDEDETDEDEGQRTSATSPLMKLPDAALRARGRPSLQRPLRRVAEEETDDDQAEEDERGTADGEDQRIPAASPAKLRNVALAARIQRLPGLARRLAEEIRTPPLLPARTLIQAVTGLEDSRMGPAWSTVSDIIRQAQERKLIDEQQCVSRNNALELLTFVAEQDKWSKGLRHQVFMALERKWHKAVFVEVDRVLKSSSSPPSASSSKQPASSSASSSSSSLSSSSSSSSSSAPPPPPAKSPLSSKSSTSSSSASSASSSSSLSSSSSPFSSSSSSASAYLLSLYAPVVSRHTVGPRAVPQTSTAQQNAPVISSAAGQPSLLPKKQAPVTDLPQPTTAVGSSPSPGGVAALDASPAVQRGEPGLSPACTNDMLLREALEYARPLLEAFGHHHWERAQFACSVAQLWQDPSTTGGGILPVACLMAGLIEPECTASQRQAGHDPVFLHVYGLGVRLGLPPTDHRLHRLHTILSHVHQHGFTCTSSSTAPAEEVALVQDAHELWSLHPLQLMRSPATNAVGGDAASVPSSSLGGDDRTGSARMEAKLKLARERALKGLRTQSGKQMAGLLLLAQ